MFQTVHNDLWDFDLPMQPSLIDFDKDGKTVPALVIGTKAGQIYVLDRATGEPLTDVKEVPVKAANIPNEPYSPTQPKSLGMPQIGAQHLTESDMWGRRRTTSCCAGSISNRCVMTACTPRRGPTNR